MAGEKSKGPRVPFPSLVWLESYIKKLNESGAYEEAAKSWEGAMLFVIKAGEITPIDLHVWLDLWHGKCRDGKFYYSKDGVEADYIFEGPEANWIKLLDGELDPIKGLMAGKFRLTGNMNAVMRHVKAAQVLVNELQYFDFEFLHLANDKADSELRFEDDAGELVLLVDKENGKLTFKK